jgi:hypothetical protein
MTSLVVLVFTHEKIIRQRNKDILNAGDTHTHSHTRALFLFLCLLFRFHVRLCLVIGPAVLVRICKLGQSINFIQIGNFIIILRKDTFLYQ